MPLRELITGLLSDFVLSSGPTWRRAGTPWNRWLESPSPCSIHSVSQNLNEVMINTPIHPGNR